MDFNLVFTGLVPAGKQIVFMGHRNEGING